VFSIKTGDTHICYWHYGNTTELTYSLQFLLSHKSYVSVSRAQVLGQCSLS